MKHNGVCPKCNGTDILLIPGKAGAYGVGNNIPVGATVFSYALVNRYLCCSCGYSEEWVDKDEMDKLKKKYQKKRTQL
jgi:Zn ribbon nucleic-acid-binding protein